MIKQKSPSYWDFSCHGSLFPSSLCEIFLHLNVHESLFQGLREKVELRMENVNFLGHSAPKILIIPQQAVNTSVVTCYPCITNKGSATFHPPSFGISLHNFILCYFIPLFMFLKQYNEIITTFHPIIRL